MASSWIPFRRGCVSFVNHCLPPRLLAIPEPGQSTLYFRSNCSYANRHWPLKARLYLDQEPMSPGVPFDNRGMCCRRMASTATEASCPLHEANTVHVTPDKCLCGRKRPLFQPCSLHTANGWRCKQTNIIYGGTEPVVRGFTLR